MTTAPETPTGLPPVAYAICRELHPYEWAAPVPRTTPCVDCLRAAHIAILRGAR
ncbi:MAG TPA: hypothetical protein VN088_05385 [Nocardioides sp.]|nr:hypothetical protein [Nocardioides sp.]